MSSLLASLDDSKKFEKLLPEGILEEVYERKQRVQNNTEHALNCTVAIEEHHDQLSGTFNKLKESFTRKHASYTRLETASRTNSAAHSTLGNTFRELAQQLRESAKSIKETYPLPR